MNQSKNKLISVLVVVAVLGGAYLFNQSVSVRGSEVSTSDSENVLSETKSQIVEAPSIVVDVKVEGGSFYFSPSEIKVRRGDKVRITFFNKEGFHDWVLDEFNAKTPQLKAGETSVVEFIADKAGTFEYYCSVGNDREMGMVGKLIVE